MALNIKATVKKPVLKRIANPPSSGELKTSVFFIYELMARKVTAWYETSIVRCRRQSFFRHTALDLIDIA
jgi:hypothetical protein